MIAEEAGIPTNGNAGLRRLGPVGAFTTISYSKRTNSRIDFDKMGWMHFLKGKTFRIDQPVLIILRRTDDASLEVMVEMQII